MPIDDRLSADVSRALNEPLYGTIKASDVYFLLEYNGTYEHDAWSAADIPQAVKEKIQSYPNSHQLLIRQPGQSGESDNQITLFVVHANTEEPKYYRLNVPNYESILDVDFDAVLCSEIVAGDSTPLYTVCTNGKRDICCSKYGMIIYNGLTAIAGDSVWQVSHIGGHRLAATMYCFPHAICYGFLTEEDCPKIVESYTDGKILLNKLRGHGIMDKPAQAADYFLRRELNEDNIDAVKVLNSEDGDGNWRVTLQAHDTIYCITIAQAESINVLATTGDDFYKPVPQFKFVGYEEISAIEENV